MNTRIQQIFLNRLRDKATEIDDIYQMIYEALDFDLSDDDVMVGLSVAIINELSELNEDMLNLISDTKNFIYDMEIELEKIYGREGEGIDV